MAKPVIESLLGRKVTEIEPSELFKQSYDVKEVSADKVKAVEELAREVLAQKGKREKKHKKDKTSKHDKKRRRNH